MQPNRILVLSGALILILASRLPWMSVPVLYGVQGSAYEAIEIGWEDNGYVTGGIGFILLLGGIFWRGIARAIYLIPGTILAAYAVSVVLGCFKSILDIDPKAGFFAATDIGIYITFLGALLALAGTVREYVRKTRQPNPVPTEAA